MGDFRRILAVWVLLASPAWGERITVSAAISLKEALTEIAGNFQKATGDEVRLNFGASGQLAAQIAEGAPVDAFVSAGVLEIDQLAAKGLIDPTSRRNVCENSLVLIVPSDAVYLPTSFSDLADARMGRIAMGQPGSVPAGRYAEEVLDYLHIAEEVKPKLVYGENVRQVLDYVERGEVDGGIVYATDAVIAGGKVRVSARAAASTHSPIEYPGAVIAHSTKSGTARRFLDFLGLGQSKKILMKYGFVTGSAGAGTAPSP